MGRWFVVRVFLLVLLVVLGACRQGAEHAPPSDQTAPIQTDQTAYTLEVSEPYAQFSMTATYLNRTKTPIYIETCGPSYPFNFSFENFSGERWETTQELATPGCASALFPHEVRPGGQFTQTFENLVFDLVPNLKGTYRIVWGNVKARPGESSPLLPKAERVSNAFVLEAP